MTGLGSLLNQESWWSVHVYPLYTADLLQRALQQLMWSVDGWTHDLGVNLRDYPLRIHTHEQFVTNNGYEGQMFTITVSFCLPRRDA